MAPKVWKIKTTIDDRRTSEQHHENEAVIKNASDKTCPKSTTMPPKAWKIKNTVVASDHQQQEAGIMNPVKLLVLPLRGIIVHRAHRSRPETISRNRRPDFCYGKFLVYKRPFCLDFLKFCFERFHVGLWSSAKEYNLQGILTNVMGDLKNKLLFTWDQEHCTDSGFMCLENQDKPLFLKELDHLWQKKYPNLPWGDEEYSASNTLLIASPEKALLNPPNTAIFPLNYDPANKKDDFLGPKGELRVFLEGLAEAEDVQSYVQDHPIGEPEILPSHPDWDYYCKIICYINKKRNIAFGFFLPMKKGSYVACHIAFSIASPCRSSILVTRYLFHFLRHIFHPDSSFTPNQTQEDPLMAPKIWRIKSTVDDPHTSERHSQKEAGINNASNKTCPKSTSMPPKDWKIKTTVVASGDQLTDEQDDEKEAGINNVVVASGDTEDDKEAGIDSGIPLDRLHLGSKKKLLVIPLRGIIVHRAHRTRPDTIPRNRRPDFCYGNFLVYKRPFCLEFLRFCFEKFNVGLWSSSREQNLQGILTNVMGDLKNKLLFTWDQKQCTNSGFMCVENKEKPLFLKELDHLWQKKDPNLPWSDGEYSASNTLLITYPEKTLLNPPNTSISPLNYDPENKKDDFLGPKGELRVFLEGLAEAEDVQTYVQDHPIGDPDILPSHPDWDYYCKIICSINKKRNKDKKKLL
ncbi:hypothetical protein E3N88_33098 [Mikania micrantha]|uniref:FCP1 homology domain-containing protein n=1 Tax=Mikania micrantha TaxID=192012 RepID=A0A5N6MCZ4_9ASTR|nr:hypothetical protein E3N88_33098 [Mikania micrantha]